jgi:hypothetical protein
MWAEGPNKPSFREFIVKRWQKINIHSVHSCDYIANISVSKETRTHAPEIASAALASRFTGVTPRCPEPLAAP